MRKLHCVLLWTFTVVAAIRFLLWAGFIFITIRFRGDIAYPEGARAYAVQRVATEQPLYQDFRRLPHIMVPYGPVYFYVAGLVHRWCGPEPFAAYLAGRGVSLTAFVALLVLCCIWARELAGWRFAALVTVFAAAGPKFLGPCAAAQVDSMAVLASACCLWIAARPWGAWRWSLVWLFAMVAWSTKQNAIAIVPAVAVWLLQSRQWRQAAVWLGCWSAGIAAVWWLFDWQTEGMFTLNAAVSLRRPLDPARAVQILLEILPFVAVAFATAAWNWPRSVLDEPRRLVAWWFFFSLSLSVASCFGEGAGANYLFEPWIAACLLVPGVLGGRPVPTRVRRALATASASAGDGGNAATSGPRGRLAPSFWLLLLILSSAQDVLYVAGLHSSYQTSIVAKTSARERAAGLLPNVLALMTRYPGEVFIQYPFLTLASRREPVVLDIVHYRLMVQCGVIAPERLIERLKSRDFELVVLNTSLPERYNPDDLMRWPEPVWKALSENYSLLRTIDSTYVYVPND